MPSEGGIMPSEGGVLTEEGGMPLSEGGMMHLEGGIVAWPAPTFFFQRDSKIGTGRTEDPRHWTAHVSGRETDA